MRLPTKTTQVVEDDFTVVESFFSRSHAVGPKPYVMKPYERTHSLSLTPIGTYHTDLPATARDTPHPLWNCKPLSSVPLDNPLPTSYLHTDHKALRRFFENAKGVDVNALVTLGELPKTLGLIGDTAKRLAKMLKSLKRLDIVGAYRAIGLDIDSTGKNLRRLGSLKRTRKSKSDVFDFAAGATLEMQYGWKPLLLEVEGAAKAMAKQWDTQPHDVTIKGGASRRMNNAIPPTSEGIYLKDGALNSSLYLSSGYYTNWRVVDPMTRIYSQLGLTNLGSLVWELLPWSFVIDWMLPVGDWIEAQSAYAGLEYIEGCQTKVVSYEMHGKHVVHPGGYSCDLDESYSYYKMHRKLLEDPPSAHRLLRFAEAGDLFNFAHARNSLALLATFRR